MADVEKKIIIDIETNAQQATQKVDGLKGALKGVDKATGGLLSSLKKLVTNPYIAIIGAIVAVFMKLRDAIKGSDDAGTAFARLGAMLKVPLTVLGKIINGIAEGLGRVANVMADVMGALMPKAWREEAEAENELVVATDRLEDTEREYARNHAEREAEISELSRRARDAEHRTATERANDIAQIKRLRQQDYYEQKEIIQERIRLFKLETRNQKSLSDEQKNRLVELNNQLTTLNKVYQDGLRETDRLSRQVSDTLIEEWMSVSASHDDATAALHAYYLEQIRLEKLNLGKNIDNLAVKFGKLTDDIIPKLLNDANKVKSRFGEALQNVQFALASGGDTDWIVEAMEEVTSQGYAFEQVFGKDAEVVKTMFKNMVEQINSTKKALGELEEAEKQSQENLDKRIAERNSKNAEQNRTNLQNIQKETAAIQDKIYNETSKYYDDLTKLWFDYARTVENTKKEIDEKEKILLEGRTSDGKKLTKEMRAEYERQIQLLQAYLVQVEKNYVIAQARLMEGMMKDVSKQLNLNNTNGVTALQNFLNESKTFASEEEELANTVVEHTASQAQALTDIMAFAAEEQTNWLENANNSVKNWVNENAENITTVADIFGSMASIVGVASEQIQKEYDALVSKGADMTDAEIEQAKALAHKQMVLTKAQIILNEVMSIGNALVAATSAASVSFVAAPIVFAATLATLTAGIVSTIAGLKSAEDSYNTQIQELNSIKAKRGYATGGYIEGAGTATSDSIPARLSNGESVINARSTARFYDLLSAINQAGGGVAFPNAMSVPQLNFANGGVAQSYENTYKMIESAVAGIQPVVSVKEITKVQNRLKAKEII